VADHLPYRPATGTIPTSPGVYRFRDAAGRVLYVGKAKSLRQRLSNYFAPLETLHERTRHMVTSASSVEWTVVRTEIEALHLEYTWIQEFSPPFNVRMKDDKSYPFMAVTLAEESPRVMVTRNRKIRGAKYFGPYPKVWAVNEAIELMIKVFPIRTCSPANYERAMKSGKPCFAGQIGKCGGPCSGKVSIEEHRAIVDDFVRFMESYDRRFILEFQDRMREAALDQRYEEAAQWRDRVSALENVLSKSAVVLDDSVAVDVIGLAEDELTASVQLFTVRGGRVRGVRGWVLDKEMDLDRSALVQQVLQQVYGGAADPPAAEVVLDELPDDAEALGEWLGELRGGRVTLRAPRRGAKRDILTTARVNAVEALKQYKLKRTSDYVARSDALGDLQEALGLDEAPLRIECYDISHLQGTGIVGSMVVFEDGLAKKSDYRRFNIASSTDDTDSIHQVITRRLAHLRGDDQPSAAETGAAARADAESGASTPPEAAAPASATDPEADLGVPRTRARFAYRPQLLLIDGGVPQVNAAKRALDESGVEGIAIAGIAKRLEELWLPGDDFPVILPRNSEALFLVQRLRDEAHRFAITAQRAKRRRDIGTQLADVPGLGPARTSALLRHFGSAARLRSASVEQLVEVPGVGEATARAVLEAIGRPGAEDGA